MMFGGSSLTLLVVAIQPTNELSRVKELASHLKGYVVGSGREGEGGWSRHFCITQINSVVEFPAQSFGRCLSLLTFHRGERQRKLLPSLQSTHRSI